MIVGCGNCGYRNTRYDDHVAWYMGSVGFVFNRPFPNPYNAASEQLQSERIGEIEECLEQQNV